MNVVGVLGIFLLAILIGGLAIIFVEQFIEFERVARRGPPGPTPTVIVPAHQISESGLFSSSSSSLGGGGGLSLGAAGGKILSGQEGEFEGLIVGQVTHTVESDVPLFQTLSYIRDIVSRHEQSPFGGLVVFLDRNQNLTSSSLSNEYFILLVSNRIDEPITITGWKVFDFKKRVAYEIPKGVDILDPGGTNTQVPIQVLAGDSVVVNSGHSPIGFSFKVNKCTGFRTQFKRFSPSIKTACPRATQTLYEYGEVPYTDDRCFEIVNSLGTCRAATAIPAGVSKECTTLLSSEITEGGCVNRYRNDSNFYTKNWRVYLESNEKLWYGIHNALYLLDQEDRIVATYIY